MRLNRLMAYLAVVGVLMHAVAAVRHHTLMLNAFSHHAELVASLSVICHNDGSVTRLPASEVPTIPQPAENQASCPVCLGMLASFVPPSPPASPISCGELVAMVQFFARSESISTRLASVNPPTRGPPATT